MVEATGTTRRGRVRAAARQKRDVKMLPALKRNLPLTEPMNQEQIERMDAASMHILENVGVHFRDPIAIADWKRVGAKVVDETVFLDRHMVRELISTIPSEFTYHARNPEHNLPFGKGHSMFIPMTGAPYLRDWTMCGAIQHWMIWRIFTNCPKCCLRCIHPRTISLNPMITRSSSAICASPIRR